MASKMEKTLSPMEKIKVKTAELEVLASVMDRIDYIRRDCESTIHSYTHEENEDGVEVEVKLEPNTWQYQTVESARAKIRACDNLAAFLEQII